MKNIKFSHSKLNTILKCPMSYYLSYELGIFPKFEKTALSLGSAVHWGIENETCDLKEYYEKNSKFKNKLTVTDERILAEEMISGYFKHKDELFNDILKDDETGEILECLEEVHEVYIDGILNSTINEKKQNVFVGIIDLLLLTEKGFIVIDYKTSSKVPNWDDYLDQLYRYIFLLKSEFPEIPVYKIAIINLRKSNVKRKNKESDSSFRKRLQIDYQLNDEKHIDAHVFKSEKLNNDKINNYIDNLSKMCDCALSIVNSEAYYINFTAAEDYGGSELKELLYNNPGAYTLYNVRDTCYNKISNKVENYRDMRQSDVDFIFNKSVNYIMLRYADFEIVIKDYITKMKPSYKELELNKESFFEYIFEKYVEQRDYDIDLELLEMYWKTFFILNIKK